MAHDGLITRKEAVMASIRWHSNKIAPPDARSEAKRDVADHRACRPFCPAPPVGPDSCLTATPPKRRTEMAMTSSWCGRDLAEDIHGMACARVS